MTREELKQADTKKLISALQYCGRDSYYATYCDEVVDEIIQRLKRTEELETRCNELFLQTCEQAEQIEKMKSQYNYAFNQLCKSREILCSMLIQYRDKKEIDYFTRECGEKLLKEGVYKND